MTGGSRSPWLLRRLVSWVLLGVVVPAAAQAAPLTTERVSVSSAEAQLPLGSDSTFGPSISADGRFVVFDAAFDSRVSGVGGGSDLFVRDLRRGRTTLVSVRFRPPAPGEYNEVSDDASVSGDGRFVAFSARVPNLEGNEAGLRTGGIFVRDVQRGVTRRISVTPSGRPIRGYPRFPSISASGRLVAYSSSSSRLVRGDTNRATDVFVYDRRSKRTTRVSVAASGEQGNARSSVPVISANGRHVAYWSRASNLVDGDSNRRSDAFVHDRRTGVTTLVTVSSTGQQVEPPIFPIPWSGLSISATGRYVAFAFEADGLVVDDVNGRSDVFVRDVDAGTTRRVSVAADGNEACTEPAPVGRGSYVCGSEPSISGDGRYVAFTSDGSNLVTGDTNGVSDVFVHDTQTMTTTRVSVAADGRQPSCPFREVADCHQLPAISADGRYVAFGSYSARLVDRDTNRHSDVFVRGPLP